MKLPYVREAGAVVVLVLLTAGGAWLYRAGGNAVMAECAADKAAMLLEQQQALRDAQQAAAEANESLRGRLAKPAPGQTIREVVRNVPSDCRVDPAIAGSVREAVAEANRRAAAK